MSHLKPAYTPADNPEHIVVLRVPKAAFDELFLQRCPRRGAVNAVMTQLFQKFHQAVITDTIIPPHYELDNDDHFQRILDGCSFGLTLDNGHLKTKSRRTKRVRNDKPTTSKQSPDSSSQARDRKQKTRRKKTEKDS